tara:strand:- start:385 stop:2106 length:1722 start_codon:yes stop_codon:yes gene_type:complete
MLSKDIKDAISDSLKDSFDSVRFFQDQVVILDDKKSKWDNAIFKLDNEILGEIQIVNRAIDDVKDAYQDRIVSGCRTDMFWMLTNENTEGDDPEYTFRCTKLNGRGYTEIVHDVVGINSTHFFMLEPGASSVSGITTRPLTGDEFGFDPRNYFGIRYYDQAFAQDIGDTFVTSFIGTMKQSSNLLTVMNPVSAGSSEVLEAGQIVICGKDGVFPSTTTIVGVNTTQVDLRGIPTLVGIETSLTTVNILNLSNSAGVAVSAPEADGSFVSFRVLDDPDAGPLVAISTVTSNGNAYGVSQEYEEIVTTSNRKGFGCLVLVKTNASGGISTVIPQTGGMSYTRGETITISGDLLGGIAGTDDVTVLVNWLQSTVGSRHQYQLSFEADPFTPQTVGIMQTSTLGIGVSTVLDHSGNPKGTQSWNLFMDGVDIGTLDNPLIIRPPNVGSDKSWWTVGFSSRPMNGGSVAEEGDIILTDDLNGLYQNLSPCAAALETAITNTGAAASTSESSFLTEGGKNNTLIGASNGLRDMRNDTCLQIWGTRQSIGSENENIDNQEKLSRYIGLTTVTMVVDDLNE